MKRWLSITMIGAALCLLMSGDVDGRGFGGFRGGSIGGFRGGSIGGALALAELALSAPTPAFAASAPAVLLIAPSRGARRLHQYRRRARLCGDTLGRRRAGGAQHHRDGSRRTNLLRNAVRRRRGRAVWSCHRRRIACRLATGPRGVNRGGVAFGLRGNALRHRRWTCSLLELRRRRDRPFDRVLVTRVCDHPRRLRSHQLRLLRRFPYGLVSGSSRGLVSRRLGCCSRLANRDLGQPRHALGDSRAADRLRLRQHRRLPVQQRLRERPDVGTAQDYAQQATTLADQGQKAERRRKQNGSRSASSHLCKATKRPPTISSKSQSTRRHLRGNYYDGLMDTTTPIYGSVDKKIAAGRLDHRQKERSRLRSGHLQPHENRNAGAGPHRHRPHPANVARTRRTAEVPAMKKQKQNATRRSCCHSACLLS